MPDFSYLIFINITEHVQKRKLLTTLSSTRGEKKKSCLSVSEVVTYLVWNFIFRVLVSKTVQNGMRWYFTDTSIVQQSLERGD